MLRAAGARGRRVLLLKPQPRGAHLGHEFSIHLDVARLEVGRELRHSCWPRAQIWREVRRLLAEVGPRRHLITDRTFLVKAVAVLRAAEPSILISKLHIKLHVSVATLSLLVQLISKSSSTSSNTILFKNYAFS